MLEGKYILLGVSSSVACYKALELTRLLKKAGAEVRVTMTHNATKLITPLEFEALSGNPVYSDVFSRENPWEVEHIVAADWGDLYVLAPATANIIAKLAHGIADDAPTTLYLAFPGVCYVAPAMHTEMWNHPATQENIAILRRRGVRIIGPESGDLASGDTGMGRLSAPQTIFDQIKSFFSGSGSLSGKQVLITAGPTREPLDPIRFLSNRSSGKMGYALAEEAATRGAKVILVSGPTSLSAPRGAEIVNVTTAEEMMKACTRHTKSTDLFIFAAAVSDFRSEKTETSKIKKQKGNLALSLVQNPDIAKEIGKKARPDQILVGFAAETQNLREEALRKLNEKKLHLIVGNDVSQKNIGMGSDENEAVIISNRGTVKQLERMNKKSLAAHILDIVEQTFLREKEE